MSAHELIETLATQDPALYEMLRTHELPPNWKPNPTMIAATLASVNRDQCRTCEKAGAPMQCSSCGVARYCSVECQRLDWIDHKKVCTIDHVIKAALKETLYAGHPDET